VKVIICGGRNFTDYQYLNAYVKMVPPWIEITEVVSGHADGADTLGEQWATKNNIPLKIFPADWERLGRRAGPIRNIEMSKYAEGCIAFWNGTSTGTKHMIDTAIKAGMWTYVIRTDIPWCKQFRTSVHLSKTVKEPILNNVEIYNEKSNM
jgi:hypothetical protein